MSKVDINNLKVFKQELEKEFVKKENNEKFFPLLDYDPTTKKYVDDYVGQLNAKIPLNIADGSRGSIRQANAPAEFFDEETGDSYELGRNAVALGAGKAAGNTSFSMGLSTEANAANSQALGNGTISSGANQLVYGRYNVEDTGSKYATIIGNGTRATRSNAHTVDWNGNAWYKGNVYVGGTSQSDANELATTTYVDNAIATSVPDLPENVVTSVNNSGTDQVRIVVSETKPTTTTGYVDLWVNPNISAGEGSGDSLPIGTILPYGNVVAPNNYLVCDGSAVSRTTYSSLFEVIGTVFGVGDGSTTFNLPDLRGRMPVGYDKVEFTAIGETGGEVTHTLTINEIPSHNHVVTMGNQTGSVEYDRIIGNKATWRGTELTSNTGGDQPHNNMPPYQVTNYIIKAFQGAGVTAKVVNEKTTSDNDTYSCDYINNNERQMRNYTVIPDNADLNSYNQWGTYRSTSTARTSTMKNVPTGVTGGFTLFVVSYTSTYNSNKYMRQELIQGIDTYVRTTADGGSTWGKWYKASMVELA